MLVLTVTQTPKTDKPEHSDKIPGIYLMKMDLS